ncbi:hypothetical protein BDQ12DRAFT_751115 [Crucibulum laeve]|uniref:Uncharacterized protein n=1 Tax=Crucibulum laeve TaxID=68775 RepID=A0A5C3MGN6_9AGAR|nr:hypothetical protein BDQ12DRAFT_751115 [Crucibulum laeve]
MVLRDGLRTGEGEIGPKLIDVPIHSSSNKSAPGANRTHNPAHRPPLPLQAPPLPTTHAVALSSSHILDINPPADVMQQHIHLRALSPQPPPLLCLGLKFVRVTHICVIKVIATIELAERFSVHFIQGWGNNRMGEYQGYPGIIWTGSENVTGNLKPCKVYLARCALPGQEWYAIQAWSDMFDRPFLSEARKPAAVTPLDCKFKVSPEKLEEKYLGPWTRYQLKYCAFIQEAQFEGDVLQQNLQQLCSESMVGSYK